MNTHTTREIEREWRLGTFAGAKPAQRFRRMMKLIWSVFRTPDNGDSPKSSDRRAPAAWPLPPARARPSFPCPHCVADPPTRTQVWWSDSHSLAPVQSAQEKSRRKRRAGGEAHRERNRKTAKYSNTHTDTCRIEERVEGCCRGDDRGF